MVDVAAAEAPAPAAAAAAEAEGEQAEGKKKRAKKLTAQQTTKLSAMWLSIAGGWEAPVTDTDMKKFMEKVREEGTVPDEHTDAGVRTWLNRTRVANLG